MNVSRALRRSLLAFAPLALLAGSSFAQGLNWTEVTVGTHPSVRGDANMVYDSARQVTVLFGGYGGTNLNDTWEFDGVQWTNVTPAVSPPARKSFAMAYDSARGKVVLFGGLDRGTWPNHSTFSDTWEFDGSTWTEVTPLNPSESPSSRYCPRMAYDSDRGKIVLFGGFGSWYLGDTWEWDGTNWENVTPSVSPATRCGQDMAYDSARQRIVMFGGESSSFGALGDTWEFDGTTWTLLAPAASPSARWHHRMAYDSTRQKVLLFGGWGSAYQDTWEFDGATWAELEPAADPSPRYSTGLVYDSARKSVVLFGGYLHSGAVLYGDDTWELREDPWTNLGGGSPGVFGVPELTVEGPLTAGSTLSLDLQNAPPFNLILAWLSFSSTPFNALGGTIHAFPYSAQFLRLTTATGSHSESPLWPSGIAPGMDLYLQFLVQDFSVPDKITLSNAMTATTP